MTSPGHMLAAAQSAVTALRPRLTAEDEPMVVQYLLTARAIDKRGVSAPEALYRRHTETYDRLRDVADARTPDLDPPDVPGLVPAFARFAFEEPDPSDPGWQPGEWELFAPHDAHVLALDYVRRRDELLAAIRALIAEAEADRDVETIFERMRPLADMGDAE